VRARSRYRLIVTKGGRGPVWLSDPGRRDRIEVVGVEEGEVVFFWELPPRPAARLVRALREDLAALEADEFLAAWREAAAG
jgi:hypothetical protein